jgi:phosphoribosylanthranilate isomerase
MIRTRIKICGITRPQDALAAAENGADAIGLVFHAPAPRNVTARQAREILSVLPPFVTPVALFVDQPPQVVLDTAAELNIRHAQLHGDEQPDEIAELGGLTVIKAVRVERERIRGTLDRWRAAVAVDELRNVRGIVLETGGTKEAGGTGIANDWVLIRELKESGAFDGLPSIIAAGGLKPETVAAVVRELRPWAVDVSSGVESVLGQKSIEKIEQFVQAVREADQT